MYSILFTVCLPGDNRGNRKQFDFNAHSGAADEGGVCGEGGVAGWLTGSAGILIGFRCSCGLSCQGNKSFCQEIDIESNLAPLPSADERYGDPN